MSKEKYWREVDKNSDNEILSKNTFRLFRRDGEEGIGDSLNKE